MAKLNRKPPAEVGQPIPKPKLNRKPRPTPQEVKSHWDIVTISSKNCFVCDKPFRPLQRRVKIGEGLERHERCDANSAQWHKKFKNCKTLGR